MKSTVVWNVNTSPRCLALVTPACSVFQYWRGQCCEQSCKLIRIWIRGWCGVSNARVYGKLDGKAIPMNGNQDGNYTSLFHSLLPDCSHCRLPGHCSTHQCMDIEVLQIMKGTQPGLCRQIVASPCLKKAKFSWQRTLLPLVRELSPPSYLIPWVPMARGKWFTVKGVWLGTIGKAN